MVNLRPRAALEIATAAGNSAHSISTVFRGSKATTQTRKRLKTEQDDSITNLDSTIATKKSKKTSSAVLEIPQPLPFLSPEEVLKATTIAYPKLPFELSEAIQHLRSADVRFHNLLDTVELTPYNELIQGQVKELDLFRTLTSSILGQQVSWLAARAILYRFIRLFFPSLPEKPDFISRPRESLPFPHPIDVAKADFEFLKSAGLSGAKTRYVQDIAIRFSDGRLDARKIIEMNEEQCIEELVKIKGVGRWTAEMLLIFALRRANILPVGDLGVQRGMVLFYLANADGPAISNRKKKKEEEQDEKAAKVEGPHLKIEPVSTIETHLNDSQVEVEHIVSGLPQTSTGPEVKIKKEEYDTGTMQALPECISYSLLKSRGEGKKAKGNVYLTPDEMEALAKPWAPFRSVASFLMWTCVDGD